MMIEMIEPINLLEIENLRKWAYYMPKCFVDNLKDEKYRNRLIEDRAIVNKIENLYSLIKTITGVEPDLKNEFFYIGKISNDQYNEYQKLIIPSSLCIKTYANFKLTDEEKKYCYSYLQKCTKENSFVIDKRVDSIESFFLKSYIKYLLVHDNKSDYVHSIVNINEDMEVAEKKLTKGFKRIENNEIKAWHDSKKRVYN